MTDKVEPVAWWYDIQYGPENEANYAWVYRGGEMIGTMKIHHAQIVVALIDQVKGLTDRLEHVEKERHRQAQRRAENYNRAVDAEAALAEARKVIEELVYETTHLSPEKDDGSHWCKISKAALTQAREWLQANKEDA